MTARPALTQVNVIVRDMAATLASYRRLGWAVEDVGQGHAVAEVAGGIQVDFDTVEFAAVWDSGSTGATGGSTVLGLSTDSRAAVDELYATLVEAGHHGRQPPYDAFWGSRYAIVNDPDGNPVGLMSPGDDAHRFWPPTPAPRAAPGPTVA